MHLRSLFRHGVCCLQEVDKFGRDKHPGRLDIEALPYVQACFKASS